MQETYIKDQSFNQNTIQKGEYESCIFKNCNLANSNLSEMKFIDCEFNGCNLSLAILNGTAFQNVTFIDCKMLGLQYNACNGFGFSVFFEGCQMNHSSFFKVRLKKTRFINCQLEEIDFSEADLSQAEFDNCNLSQSVFNHTLLEKADFRTSYNITIDPEANKIKKAKFSLQETPGLLRKYNIDIER